MNQAEKTEVMPDRCCRRESVPWMEARLRLNDIKSSSWSASRQAPCNGGSQEGNGQHMVKRIGSEARRDVELLGRARGRMSDLIDRCGCSWRGGRDTYAGSGWAFTGGLDE